MASAADGSGDDMRARYILTACGTARAAVRGIHNAQPSAVRVDTGGGGEHINTRLKAAGRVLGIAHDDRAEIAAEIADRIDVGEACGQRRIR